MLRTASQLFYVHNVGGSSEKYTKISSSSSVVSESPTCSTNDTVLEMVLRDMPELSIDQKEQFVNLLLEYKADPNLVEDGRHSPLLQAVVLGAPKIVKALLDAKANVNYKGIENYTPLHAHFRNGKYFLCNIFENISNN